MPIFAIPFPAINPYAIQVGWIGIRWYALAYIAGIVGGWWYSRRLVSAPSLWGETPRPSVAVMDDMIVWIALGIVLGGRIGYVLFYDLPKYMADPLEIVMIGHGGMSFHGGFVGVIVAIVLFLRSIRQKGLSTLAMLDVAAVVTPIGLFCGRIANFVNGELWGRTAPDVPWAMVFPTGGPLPRHPSQLYEAFSEGILLFVVLGVAARIFGFRRPGLLGGLFTFGYAIARIVSEFFREPDAQLGFLFGSQIPFLQGGVTMGMLLSIGLAVAGLVLMWLAAQGKTRMHPPAALPAVA